MAKTRIKVDQEKNTITVTTQTGDNITITKYHNYP